MKKIIVTLLSSVFVAHNIQCMDKWDEEEFLPGTMSAEEIAQLKRENQGAIRFGHTDYPTVKPKEKPFTSVFASLIVNRLEQDGFSVACSEYDAIITALNSARQLSFSELRAEGMRIEIARRVVELIREYE